MSVRVLSYNVLADGYIRRDHYPRTPPERLDPAWRIPAVVRRALEVDADLLCLQEVEPAMHAAFAAALAGTHDGWHAAKTGRREGSAIFARRSLGAAAARELRYRDAAPGGRDSGHLALILEVATPRGTLAVASTHLKWDPPETPPGAGFGDRQAALLVAEVAAPGPRGWIIAGDLNATPDHAVCRALAAAGLADAGALLDQATSNAAGRARRIDHIVVSRSLTARALPLPAIDDATPMPSDQHPSDHLPLTSEVAWR